MKRNKKIIPLMLIALFMHVVSNAQNIKPGNQAVDSVRAATNIRTAKYPLILPNHHVVFHVKAPDAQKVQVDLGKKYDLVKNAEGYWNVTTDSVGEGFHYYSLLIDGVAVADPASESFYGMGRMASGIEIPFSAGQYYAIKDVPHGDIRIKTYYSTVTNSWRRLLVYAPPATTLIQMKNTRSFTFYTEAVKMNAAGQPREKQI
jgi:RNase P/RNase MRP subunit p29